MRVFVLVFLILFMGSAWAASSKKHNAQPNAAETNNAVASPEQALNFFDSFEAYTAGVQVCVQTGNWIPWGGVPGAADDPFVSAAQAHSGVNSVVIVQNNDLVKDFGPKTSGVWQISFQVYIPTGKAGYFNTLAEFTLPSTFNWGVEVYFDLGGGGRCLGGSATPVAFTWAPDTWQSVQVIVDLNTDMAEFWFNGTMVHSWQWTLGASGGGSPLQVDANDFFGATADDEMYMDDYSVEEIVPGILFSDNFDGYNAGVHLALQNPVHWTTWSNMPGSGEDALVSDTYANSAPNSVVIAPNNDLVKIYDSAPITTGTWKISWQMYIPNGQAGYFNTMSEITVEWAMQVYFDVGGTGRLDAGGASAATFNYAYDTWMPVEVIVDLDNDAAEFWLDGTMIYSWQYTLGTFGTPIQKQLDGNDFFGGTVDDEMYIDDYAVEEIPGVGIGNSGSQVPDEYALHQNYPNPFNPTTTISYTLKENAHVNLTIYNTLGQVVKTLVNDQQTTGTITVQWDGTNKFGARVASGVYIYRIEANDFAQSKKMVMMK